MVWDVVYYKASDSSTPAIDFLEGCPTKVAANLLAVLDAVAEAPPPQYSGGGKWEDARRDGWLLRGASERTRARAVSALLRS